MLWNYLNYLKVVCSHLLVTHLTAHRHVLEHARRSGTSTDRTGLTQTVILTVSSLTYTTETMTLNDALESFTLRCACYINVSSIVEKFHCDYVTEVVLLVISELGQVSLWCCTSLLEVTHHLLGSVLFLLVLEAHLHSCVAIFLDSLYLSYNTRTYFDNSAWHILALSTENGCHSDFSSN